MDKYKIGMIVAIVTLVAYLFLPVVSVMGMDISAFDLIAEGEIGFGMILAIAAAVIIIIGAVKKQKGMMLIGSIVGAVLMLVDVAMSDSTYSQMGVDITDVLGMGFYISTVGFIANIVIAAMIKNNQQ